MDNRVEISKKSNLKTITRPQDLFGNWETSSTSFRFGRSSTWSFNVREISFNDVIDIIHQPQIFYKEAHQKIYALSKNYFHHLRVLIY